ncbi:MAG: NADP-dependent oxidoreductase [Alphaproteobacteria bacterium]
MKNTQVTLAKRPDGKPKASDFGVVTSETPALNPGEALIENLYVSLDAGFRNWMDEGSGDNVLPAMPLDKPVMGLILGKIIESKNPDYKEGALIMARLAWEAFSILTADDWHVVLEDDGVHPLSYHLGVLGDTGMSAYFGLNDIGKPQPGETVLISAAGGAVGSIAGQIAKLKGARTIGFAGNDDKCRRLEHELGYDVGVNYNDANLVDRLADVAPNGIDVYFDNVGGPLLEVVLDQINEGARIPFCGAVATYGDQAATPGPSNLFQIVSKWATLQGFMTHTKLDRYPEARGQLSTWLKAGDIRAIEHMYEGVENCGVAFADLFAGQNFGKTVVKV